MLFAQLTVLCTLPLFAFGMKKRGVPSSFALYGYGSDFGGLPLFYADGYAYIGNVSQSSSSDAATVVFTPETDKVWIGNPNTTFSANPTAVTWSNVTFYIPSNTASDKRVGFLASDASTDGATKTGFSFYGSTAIHFGGSGKLESSFYSLQISDHIHRLYWNDTSLGQVPVVLRSVAPSNPPKAV